MQTEIKIDIKKGDEESFKLGIVDTLLNQTEYQEVCKHNMEEYNHGCEVGKQLNQEIEKLNLGKQ